MSYALRSSVLEQALSHAGIQLEVHLVHSAGGGGLFTGYFWPPNFNVPYERLYIQAGAVPSSSSKIAREYIEETVIPQFVAWVLAILARPINSPVRREEQHFFCSANIPNLSLNRTRLRRAG